MLFLAEVLQSSAFKLVVKNALEGYSGRNFFLLDFSQKIVPDLKINFAKF